VPTWESILRAHGPTAFDTAWRLLGHAADAEDVFQDAMLDAVRLRARQPIDNWGGLLRRLVTRRAIDRLRTRRNRAAPLDTDLPAPPDEPDSSMLERELAARLRAAIADLPDREATVFSLRHFGELTNPDIAAALDITPDAVAVALHKARAKLKTALGLTDPAPRRTGVTP
jgi:RNA polymerase sigma-70 factor (ECF subfamily)